MELGIWGGSVMTYDGLQDWLEAIRGLSCYVGLIDAVFERSACLAIEDISVIVGEGLDPQVVSWGEVVRDGCAVVVSGGTMVFTCSEVSDPVRRIYGYALLSASELTSDTHVWDTFLFNSPVDVTVVGQDVKAFPKVRLAVGCGG